MSEETLDRDRIDAAARALCVYAFGESAWEGMREGDKAYWRRQARNAVEAFNAEPE